MEAAALLNTDPRTAVVDGSCRENIATGALHPHAELLLLCWAGSKEEISFHDRSVSF